MVATSRNASSRRHLAPARGGLARRCRRIDNPRPSRPAIGRIVRGRVGQPVLGQKTAGSPANNVCEGRTTRRARPATNPGPRPRRRTPAGAGAATSAARASAARPVTAAHDVGERHLVRRTSPCRRGERGGDGKGPGRGPAPPRVFATSAAPAARSAAVGTCRQGRNHKQRELEKAGPGRERERRTRASPGRAPREAGARAAWSSRPAPSRFARRGRRRRA